MKKTTSYSLILISVIVVFFVLGMISISSSKGTVKDLQEGTYFRYVFQITYTGENYTNSISNGNELTVVVDEIDPDLHYATLNVTNTLAGGLKIFIVSQLDPPTPSRTQNKSFFYRSNAIGTLGENFGIQGEYFGWLHSSIAIGEKIGDWTIVGEKTQFIGAGTFATYELVLTTYQITDSTEFVTQTFLYYEQLTGILVHFEYESILRSTVNHSKVFYHEMEQMDLTSSSYNFPLLAKVMPLLIIMHAVLDMLYTYSLIIGLLIVIILAIYFIKKSFVRRL